MNQVLKTIWLWCKEQNLWIFPTYVQTKANLVDKPSSHLYIFKDNGCYQNVFSN